MDTRAARSLCSFAANIRMELALSLIHILRDFARIMDIEFVHIGKDTKLEELEKELMWNDLYWKLKS